MRTYVFVDGLNLDYGVLEDSPYKWLDVPAMCGLLLEQPHHEILKIKYFTAKLRDTGKEGWDKGQRQDLYIQALTARHPKLEVVLGQMVKRKVRGPLLSKLRLGIREVVEIQRHEEKKTDVNLSVHLLNDCWRDAYDCAVVVSNDGDLSEAMRLARSEHGKQIGLIPPVYGKRIRKISNELRRHADFVKLIHTDTLEAAQLPDIIPGTNLKKTRGLVGKKFLKAKRGSSYFA